MGLLRSLRSLVFGETWTVPLGVGASLVVAFLVRDVVPDHVWAEAGGFVIAAVAVATLAVSLHRSG
jgi:hypothetical protein